MNYATIKKYDIANGPGVRVSLFVSGCTHYCKNCFNSIAWDFNYGNPFTEEVENELLQALSNSHIAGLTLLGGEPLEPSNQRGLISFLRKVKEQLPDKTIWCYTGYTYETDVLIGKVHTEITDEFLSYLDVLVDGEFVESLKNLNLQFRGSSNQRLIDVQQSLKQKQTILMNME